MSNIASFRYAVLFALCLLSALAPVGALSDTSADDDDADDARQHYEAREALRNGKVRPLEEIIAAVRGEISGDIIEIEFEHEDGRYIYEIEMIRPSGKVIEIKVDAATKAIIEREDD
jgi:uncharacterized membrane protein YkoI